MTALPICKCGHELVLVDDIHAECSRPACLCAYVCVPTHGWKHHVNDARLGRALAKWLLTAWDDVVTEDEAA